MVPENKQNRRYKQINFIGFKIIAILHNTMLATFIKLLEIVSNCQLAPADFFPRLKSIMKGARFADVTVFQERVTAVLRSIPK
jgi:hypothetical protein